MTTLRQIIIDALREGNVISVGTTPDGDIHDEALRRLQNIIKSLYGNEAGDPLRTVDYDDLTTDFIPSNLRIVFELDGDETVDLYSNPRDGARLAVIDNGGNFATNNLILNGNGRKIESADLVTLNTNSLVREWFFRADLGNWTRISDLEAGDESPFPSEFDDYLILLLAARLNPRYGAETAAETAADLARMRRQFRARYRQNTEMASEEAIVRLPSVMKYWYMESDEDFDRGY